MLLDLYYLILNLYLIAIEISNLEMWAFVIDASLINNSVLITKSGKFVQI